MLNDYLKVRGINLEDTKLTPLGNNYDTAASASLINATAIEVNEHGAEAAEVGISEIFTSSPLPAREFTANRPFLYYITENRSGSLLLGGVVVDPTAE